MVKACLCLRCEFKCQGTKELAATAERGGMSPDNLDMFVLGVEEVGSSKRMTIYSG